MKRYIIGHSSGLGF